MKTFALTTAAALFALGGAAFAASNDSSNTVGVPLTQTDNYNPAPASGNYGMTSGVRAGGSAWSPENSPFYTPSNQR